MTKPIREKSAVSLWDLLILVLETGDAVDTKEEVENADYE